MFDNPRTLLFELTKLKIYSFESKLDHQKPTYSF